MATAHDTGVTWYDVAPAYGDGRAEGLLGEFLRGKRDTVVICTKVGLAPPKVSSPKKVVRALARPVIKAFPQLRARVAGLRGENVRMPITAATIEASVANSLRQLKTDYIDILALHDPAPEDVTNAEVLAALTRLVEKGDVRVLSVAGDLAAIHAAAPSRIFTLAQTRDTIFAPALSTLPPLPGRFLISHGAFGSGTLERASSLLAAQPAARDHLMTLVPGAGSVGDLLMSYALAANAAGVVLASMFRPDHIRANCAHASTAPNPALVAEMRRLIGAG